MATVEHVSDNVVWLSVGVEMEACADQAAAASSQFLLQV